MIGVNCGGIGQPDRWPEDDHEKFGVNPDDCHQGRDRQGPVHHRDEGWNHKGISIDELEEQGYGRRTNCRRCKVKIPRQADLACGNWGVIGDKAGKATFVEVCSEKGADLLNKAVAAGVIATEPANPKGIEIRGKVEGAMLKLGDKWRKKDFEALGEGDERLKKILAETSRCIKCYSCIEACPICYCEDCSTKNPALVKPGQVPPGFMFHLIRFSHVADSCVNCGQCEDSARRRSRTRSSCTPSSASSRTLRPHPRRRHVAADPRARRGEDREEAPLEHGRRPDLPERLQRRAREGLKTPF